MQQYWFKAKTYGWGWTPSGWQGWVVLLFYVLSIAMAAIVFLRQGVRTIGWIEYAASMVMATGVLIFICYKKGEKPRWRWG